MKKFTEEVDRKSLFIHWKGFFKENIFLEENYETILAFCPMFDFRPFFIPGFLFSSGHTHTSSGNPGS
jgi:hypothetical protein